MTYEVIILGHLHMPLYFIGTFTECPLLTNLATSFPDNINDMLVSDNLHSVTVCSNSVCQAVSVPRNSSFHNSRQISKFEMRTLLMQCLTGFQNMGRNNERTILMN